MPVRETAEGVCLFLFDQEVHDARSVQFRSRSRLAACWKAMSTGRNRGFRLWGREAVDGPNGGVAKGV